jgi:DNA-binding Lrp family transcriptional regulator
LKKGQKLPKSGFDAIDRKILAILQGDGRISLSDLSEKVNLSPSPCLRRIRRLERTGIIARYVAVLDQAKVGLPVSVFVSIKLESQRVEALERFKRAIEKWPEVLECYLRPARLFIAHRRGRSWRLRTVPETEVDADRRHRIHRFELCA